MHCSSTATAAAAAGTWVKLLSRRKNMAEIQILGGDEAQKRSSVAEFAGVEGLLRGFLNFLLSVETR